LSFYLRSSAKFTLGVYYTGDKGRGRPRAEPAASRLAHVKRGKMPSGLERSDKKIRYNF
jgi:hypothetical protein